MRSKKLGIVGFGAMGKNHLRVAKELSNVDLVGIADKDPSIFKSLLIKSNIPTFECYEKMIKDCKPDCLIIAAPTKAHYSVASFALKSGIDVLIEKPISYCLEEAETLIDLALNNQCILTVGHVERFNPAILALKEKISQGDLGKIFTISCKRASPFPLRIQDVGVSLDLATHELDIMTFLANSGIRSIKSEFDQRINKENEDSVLGFLRFENDILGLVDVNWLSPLKIRELLVTGERGAFKVDYLTQDLYFYQNRAFQEDLESNSWDLTIKAGNMIRYEIDRQEPLKKELEAFINSSLQRKYIDQIATGKDGLKALELALKLIEK